MPLETATYISDLVSSNPVGTDTLDKADDHLRLIKATLQSTFPNITGAVTPTHTDLNKLTSAGSPQFATIELGAATDTTISRVSAGVIAVEGKNVVLNGTSEVQTVGSIELGNATDTTITRSAAGLLAVEGGIIPKENRSNTFGADQTISNASGSINLNLSGITASQRSINYQTSGSNRFLVMLEADTESGSNAGSTYKIKRYSDAGSFLGDALTIRRSDGLTTLESASVTGSLTVGGVGITGNSMTLLGTLTTTSGASQSLTSLTLTGYKKLLFVLNGVSMGTGNFLIGTFIIAASPAGADAFYGDVWVDLTTGVGYTSHTVAISTGGSATNRIGSTGYSTATTTVTASTATGAFDAGSIQVYGVR